MDVSVFDPTAIDKGSQLRGGGRFISLLKENLTDVQFATDISAIHSNILIVPFFNPFIKPLLSKRVASHQVLVIYDVIPLKYPSHFPVGIRGHFYEYLMRRNLKIYDHFVTISQASKKDIHTYLNIPNDRITVIYPPVSKVQDRKESSLPFEINKPYLLYVADANWNKNIVNIGKAIKKTSYKAVFVGNVYKNNANSYTSLSHPWQQELKEFLSLFAHDDQFYFPGYVSDDDLTALYKNTTLNLLISRDEGFGLSYLEASKLKKASLLADIPIFKEIAQDSAFFVNPNNVDEIAAGINGIDSNSALRMGEQAYTRSLFFSPEQFTSGWIQLLKSLT